MLIVTLADKIDEHRGKNKNTLFFRKRLGNLKLIKTLPSTEEKAININLFCIAFSEVKILIFLFVVYLHFGFIQTCSS